MKDSRWNFYDKTNNITVVTEKNDGIVVTAFMGDNP